MNDAQHERLMNAEADRYEAIEALEVELHHKLINNKHVLNANGDTITMDDFISDIEIYTPYFVEFLQGGDIFKRDIEDQLEAFISKLAADLVDNK